MNILKLFWVPVFCFLTINMSAQSSEQSEIAKQVALNIYHAQGKIDLPKPELNFEAEGVFIEIDSANYQVKLAAGIGENLLACLGTDTEAGWAHLLSEPIYKLYSQDRESDDPHMAARLNYLAGYSLPLDDGKNLWNLLYEKFPQLQENTLLEQRIESLEKMNEQVSDLKSKFQTANYLAVIGKYGEADAYFDAFKDSYPSREIFNNSGTIKLIRAYNLYSIPARKEIGYKFPFVLDTELTGSRGSKEEEQKMLFEAAIKDFEEALKRDPDYTVPYINLACAQILLGNYTEAIYNAQKADTLADRQNRSILRGNALISLGIALAKNGDETKSKSAFRTAAEIEDETIKDLVYYNSNEEFGSPRGSGSSRNFLTREKIGDRSLSNIAFEGMSPPYQSMIVNDSLNLYVQHQESYSLFFQENTESEKSSFIQITNPDIYDGKSAGKIEIGADISEVKTAYGSPTAIRKFGRGKFYFYKKKNIVFRLDRRNEVQDWAIFYGF